jgi:fused signal recognition particle receptor
VFPYSERSGTPAARMPPVPKAARRERAGRLRAAGAAAAARFYRTRIGAELSVSRRCGWPRRPGRGACCGCAPSPPMPPASWPSRSDGGFAMALGGFFSRLKQGLSRSTQKLTDGIAAVFTKRRLDEAALDELEDLLIGADLGPAVAGRVIENFRRTRFGKEVTEEEIRTTLAEEIAGVLAPVAVPFVPDPARHPHVVLVVGVNGTGKTTTIGKLAQFHRDQGHRVMMVAGDTFRAAAVEQLQVWGSRTGCAVIAGAPEADAAGLAFDALSRARAEAADLLLIDTAGRLHNKAALMEELRKIVRVLRKQDPEAPHSVLLVLDATTGQNAVQQVRVFKEMVAVSGLIVTKLDGSARGGIVVALAEAFGLPVHAVGVGEQAADLRPFDAMEFARGLVGTAPL